MSRSIGAYLVELLQANGIDTVFGIPGVHNLELYRGLAASKIRHVLVRHEQAAGFAADGYARLSGRPAAAFTISGPGFTNILTAAAQAYSDSVPLLVISSTPSRPSHGKQWGVLHELRDQRALADGVFGAAHSAASAEDVRDYLHQCFDSLRAGRPRPAYLEVPLDVLAERTSLPAVEFPAAAPLPQAADETIDAAARLLHAAARPLVIAGGGARHAGEEVRCLVEALDCPCITTAAGKGVLASAHAAHFGASLAYAATRALIADADVVLAVGTEMAETDIYSGFKLSLSGSLIRIDVDPAKLSDHYGADVSIRSDSRAALRRITQRLTPRRGWNEQLGGATAHHRRIDAEIDAASRPAQRALDALRAALPHDGVVFSDMTQIAYLGNYAFATDGPGQWFHPSGYGTLGYALPAALGAKLACPARSVAALAGDFGLQFTLHELMTAVEERISLPILVWNNRALGQIRDDMLAAQIPPTGVVGQNPDFMALAVAYGATAEQPRDAHALTDAVRAALLRSGPTLIEMTATDFAQQP